LTKVKICAKVGKVEKWNYGNTGKMTRSAFMVSETVKVARRGQITLPSSLRKAAQIREGDYLRFVVENGTISVVVQKLVDRDQAYFWTREWQKGEREADEDIRMGRLRTFDSVDDLIAELRS